MAKSRTAAKPASKRSTIQDVARAAHVHPSTVSRVLNPRARHLVSPDAAQRVEAAAARLAYRPDPVAAGLRTRRSGTIGVLLPDIANPVFPLILRGIESVLMNAGYTAIMANTDNDAARAGAALDHLAARRIEGVILATATRRDPLIAHCRDIGLPVVLVNRTLGPDNVNAVIVDDETGIAAAVHHVVALGHNRIGHIAGPEQLSTGRARRLGFLAALKSHGLPPNAPVVHAEAYEIAAGERACERLLAAYPKLTAIVAANDLLALGCYDALAKRNLRCPRDISVTGFNDITFADRFAPPLTTIRIPHRLMGEEAARLLLAEIEHPDAPRREIKLVPELIARGSTAAVRAKQKNQPRRREDPA